MFFGARNESRAKLSEAFKEASAPSKQVASWKMSWHEVLKHLQFTKKKSHQPIQTVIIKWAWCD